MLVRFLLSKKLVIKPTFLSIFALKVYSFESDGNGGQSGFSKIDTTLLYDAKRYFRPHRNTKSKSCIKFKDGIKQYNFNFNQLVLNKL